MTSKTILGDSEVNAVQLATFRRGAMSVRVQRNFKAERPICSICRASFYSFNNVELKPAYLLGPN